MLMSATLNIECEGDRVSTVTIGKKGRRVCMGETIKKITIKISEGQSVTIEGDISTQTRPKVMFRAYMDNGKLKVEKQ